eukprot:g3117.t1
MGDNLASSSEDEKSPVGSKGPRRSDDDPAAAEALRDDMTIAGSIVGSQSEAGDALTAEAEPTAAATEPPANPAEPTASSEVGPEPITEPADPAGSTAPTSPVESEGPEPIAATEVEAGSGEEGESQQSKAWKVITPNPEVTVIEKETYEYSTLGLCELEGEDIAVEQGELSIGETLEGHAFFSSPRLDIHFGQNKAQTPLCNMKLNEEKAKALATMINDNYWYQLYIDDLPIWAFVGEHSKFALDVSRFSMMYRDNNKSLQMPSGAAPPVPKHLKAQLP